MDPIMKKSSLFMMTTKKAWGQGMDKNCNKLSEFSHIPSYWMEINQREQFRCTQHRRFAITNTCLVPQSSQVECRLESQLWTTKQGIRSPGDYISVSGYNTTDNPLQSDFPKSKGGLFVAPFESLRKISQIRKGGYMCEVVSVVLCPDGESPFIIV